MTIEEIIQLINEKVDSETARLSERKSDPVVISVKPNRIFAVCQILLNNEYTYFDLLECITGIDNGPESNEIELIYHLYSIPFNQKIALSAKLSREKPEIESICSIWKTANWLEREIYDLVGVHFLNHPDLRRILMPNDWEGHPLRKDYQTQAYYHGVKVDY